MKMILFFDKKMRTIFMLALFALPVFVSAREGLVPCGGTDQDPCELCHIFVLFNNIVTFILKSVVPSIAVFMLIIGGVMFYVSVGNPEKMEKAKKLLISTIGGVLIVYFAWGIVVAIFTALGAATWKDGWYHINCGSS